MNGLARIRHERRSGHEQVGFSLPELLIAMMLGLLLISATLSMLMATSRSNRALDGVSRLQEAGRFALYAMERDIRMAGYNGCSYVDQINHVLNPTANADQRALFAFDLPYFGWRDGSIPTLPGSFNANYARGDVLLVKNASEPLGVALTADVERDASTLPVAPAIVPPFSQLLLLSNCGGSADVFQVGNQSDDALSELGRGANVEGLWPGNQEPTTAKLSTRYRQDNSELTLAQSNLYYVGFGTAPDGRVASETSLRRTRYGLGGLLPDQELVANVYDMRVLYGMDLTHNGNADEYRRADQINTTDDWQRVVAIRIGIIAYSGDEFTQQGGDAITPQAFDPSLWDFDTDRLLVDDDPDVAAQFLPPDSRIYRFFSTTVATRNRVP